MHVEKESEQDSTGREVGKEGIATHAPAWRISHGGEVLHSVGHGGWWAQGGEARHVYGIKWRRA